MFVVLLMGMVSLIITTRLILPSFLAFHHPVESSNLLIESWISAREIEQAAAYGKNGEKVFHYFINGFNYPVVDSNRYKDSIFTSNPAMFATKSGVWLLTNGSLQINIPKSVYFKAGDTIELTLRIKGKVGAGYGAHFNVIINGHLVGGSFAQAEQENFTFHWIAGHSRLQSMFIRFNNDLWTYSGDRNLFVSGINIGHHRMIPGPANCRIIYDNNKLTTGFGSQADEMADYLIALGIDPGQITAIHFNPVKHNQTRAAAKQFTQYLDEYPLTSINLVTSGFHSRRTWITYKTFAGKDISVGVLFFPSDAVRKSDQQYTFKSDLKLLDEFISYFYNWIVIHL